MHDQMTATVLVNEGESTPFEVKTGVEQGCLKAPILFSIFISVAIIFAIPRVPVRKTNILFRFDGKLFNPPKTTCEDENHSGRSGKVSVCR